MPQFYRRESRQFDAKVVGLPNFQKWRLQGGLCQRNNIVLFQSIAVGLIHQFVETFLVNILFTKSALQKGSRGLPAPEALNVYLLYQFAIRLVGSFFQLLPG